METITCTGDEIARMILLIGAAPGLFLGLLLGWAIWSPRPKDPG